MCDALPGDAIWIVYEGFAGSGIGGIAETQEMLEFCAEHSIVSDIEITSFDKIEEAWERVVKADVKYRFVLDLKALEAGKGIRG